MRSSEKSEFSFRPLALESKNQACPAPVAASVRKSRKHWVVFRVDEKTAKLLGWKQGTLVNLYADDKKRALLFLVEDRPKTVGVRKVMKNEGAHLVDFPRQKCLAEWFEPGPMKPLAIVEASAGRLVVQVG